jgi:hypothetical protein
MICEKSFDLRNNLVFQMTCEKRYDVWPELTQNQGLALLLGNASTLPSEIEIQEFDNCLLYKSLHILWTILVLLL